MFRIVFNRPITSPYNTLLWDSTVISNRELLSDKLNYLQVNGYTIFAVFPEPK